MLPDLTVGIFFAFKKSQEKAVMIFFPPTFQFVFTSFPNILTKE